MPCASSLVPSTVSSILSVGSLSCSASIRCGIQVETTESIAPIRTVRCAASLPSARSARRASSFSTTAWNVSKTILPCGVRRNSPPRSISLQPNSRSSVASRVEIAGWVALSSSAVRAKCRLRARTRNVCMSRTRMPLRIAARGPCGVVIPSPPGPVIVSAAERVRVPCRSRSTPRRRS